MSDASNAIGSIEQIDIGLIEPAEAVFYMTEGGFTGLRYKERDYRHITLRRALPIGKPSEYISVADHENKEIGILKSLAVLEGEQLQIVTKELDNRYYCPDIIEIKSIKDKLGYVYMELLLSHNGEQEYTKSCAVKDVSRNIRALGENSVLIFDVDGNRYIVRALDKLDKKSMKRLDPFMF